ncbi:Fumarylacetoacetate (FAA) hydrolase, partial [Phytophthora palmivora]
NYVRNGGSVLLPPGIGEVVIGKCGKDITESASMDHVAGYALAIDMTARDVQAKAKKAGLPWTHAKGLDTFTPISDFIPKSAVSSPHDLNLWLKVDDELRQNGNTSDMVHSIPFLISYVSRIMTLEEGDLLITGTPEGVGPVPAGSHRQEPSIYKFQHIFWTFSKVSDDLSYVKSCGSEWMESELS